MPVRDCQRGRVYAWENRIIAPRDRSLVRFAAAHGMVDAIWAEQGLRFPPKVERLPRQARTTLADASRLCIRLPEHVPSWCILHELAHAMTTTHDDVSDGHGPLFMGVYVANRARGLAPFTRGRRDCDRSGCHAGVRGRHRGPQAGRA